MRIAVTGSSGLIGSALVPALEVHGHEVLRLTRDDAAEEGTAHWDPATGQIDAEALQGVEAIIHLAGENIGQRWTEETRRAVLHSRVDGTGLIAETAAKLDPQPRVLVCASAVGYYGLRGDEELTEESARGEGFLADVVEQWEAAAQPARDAGIRVVHLRQGIVLSDEGGALARLLLPFKLGLGGRVGSGDQYWAWISLDDAVGAYLHALDGELEGPVNVVGPQPARNREFVAALGRALRRPTVFPLPAFAVKLAFGQMGDEMLLHGQRALPARLEASGYRFAQPTLDGAMAAAVA